MSDEKPPEKTPPPPENEPETHAPEAPLPKLIASGKVIETREGAVIIRDPVHPGETMYEVNKDHGAMPGHMCWIYEDGSVELGNTPRALPENVVERTLPSTVEPHE